MTSLRATRGVSPIQRIPLARREGEEMPAVDWPAYGGDFLEKVMAVFVAQDHPNAIRRTPASGDGGIDLLVPVDAGYVVEQVKGFGGRLDAPRRRQVKESWDALCSDPRTERPIVEWHLVVPIDPTPQEESWFEGLICEAPFPCFWRGAVHWDSLAAQHPHVVDFYFLGGRERVAARSRALLAQVADPSEPLRATDVAAALDTMRQALSRDDPHYRYDFLTSSAQPPVEQLTEFLLARTTQLREGDFLTVGVLAKHDYATEDHPITGLLSVNLLDDTVAEDFTAKWEAALKFGRGLELPDGAVTMTIEAPGGLGGSVELGSGRIGPARVSNPVPEWRLAISDPAGKTRSELVLQTREHTRGPLGGAEVTMAHSSGAFTLTLQLDPLDDRPIGRMTFAANLDGQPIEGAVHVARFLNALCRPNEVVFLPRHGNRALARQAVDNDKPLLSAPLLRHLEDLAVIQTLADDVVRFPDEVDPGFANELRQYVRMLEGEEVRGTWDEMTLTFVEDTPRHLLHQLKTGQAVVHDHDVHVEVDGQTVRLGRFRTTVPAAVARDGEVKAGPVVLVPVDDRNTYTRIAIGMDSPGGQS